MVRSKKELEILLSLVPGFRNPVIELEQYVCDSSIASELMWLAYIRGDIEDKVVLDLGCGTGVLSYAALILGAKYVLCIDIDIEALSIAKEFLWNEFNNVEMINMSVENMELKRVDTIVMNPPFGVHRKGIDMVFLRKALELQPHAVYTIHKYNPESHKIVIDVVSSYGYQVDNVVVKDMKIPPIYPMHRRRVYRFKVAIYGIVKRRYA